MTSTIVSFKNYIESLPETRDASIKTWHPTRISPCPLLTRCAKCKQYLTALDFYVVRSTKHRAGRMDPLGGRRNARCKSCCLDAYKETSTELKMYRAAKARAAQKGLEFTLSIEDVVIPEYCPVLGIKLSPSVGAGRISCRNFGASPSIDRIDNSKGYTPDNIQVISNRANQLKSDGSLDEFERIAQYMKAHLVDSSQSNTNAAAEVTP